MIFHVSIIIFTRKMFNNSNQTNPVHIFIYVVKPYLRDYIHIYRHNLSTYIKTHGSESRGQEEAGLYNGPVSYLQVTPL